MMTKIVIEILVSIGFAALYLLVLMITTIIAVRFCVKGDIDDIDYTMVANIIQFFVIMVIVVEKVVRWMA